MCKYDFVKYLRNSIQKTAQPHISKSRHNFHNICKTTIFRNPNIMHRLLQLIKNNYYINILICVRKYRINTRIKYGDVDVSIKGFLTVDLSRRKIYIVDNTSALLWRKKEQA